MTGLRIMLIVVFLCLTFDVSIASHAYTNNSHAFSGFLDLIVNKPFVSIWNVPSKVCEVKHGIKLNLSFFDIDVNDNDSFLGNEIVIFYRNRLGLYPWIKDDGTYVNGGLPQLGNLTRHLERVTVDISTFIPNKEFTGLAVIDWEDWRPIFERNTYNEKQKVYIRESEKLVRQRHPDWSDDKVYEEAKREFENGAQLYMQSTLSLGRKERPGGFWGFYGFPGCYNYGKRQSTCSQDTRDFNDQLQWLFNKSSVLLPSIYIKEWFGSYEDRYLHVHGALNETRRVRQMFAGEHVPILAYTAFKYGDTDAFYDKADLINTIQQSGYAGFNGVTIWGSSWSIRSKEDCANVRDYVQNTLGPFVKSTTEFMANCSTSRCNSHGRCVSNLWSGDQTEEELGYTLSKWMTLLADLVNVIFSFILRRFDRSSYSDFKCECFQGWSGLACNKQSNIYLPK